MTLERNLVTQDVVLWQINRFEWLIRNHCPNLGPLRSKFQIYDNNGLQGMPAFSASSPDEWAQEYFRIFLKQMNYPQRPLTLVLRDKALPKRDSDKELIAPSHAETDNRYYTDQFGRPIIYADTTKLHEPGYLARHLALAISDQIQMSTQKQPDMSEDDQSALSQLTAVFLGLSHIQTPNSRLDSANDIAGETENLFATALYWSIKGQNQTQAMSLYANYYCEKARIALNIAFLQLQPYQADIERLRNLAIISDAKEPLNNNNSERGNAGQSAETA